MILSESYNLHGAIRSRAAKRFAGADSCSPSLVRFGVGGAFGQDKMRAREAKAREGAVVSILCCSDHSIRRRLYCSPSPLGGRPRPRSGHSPVCKLKSGRPPAVCDALQSHRLSHRQPRSVYIGARKPMWLCVCPAPTIRTAWAAVSNNVFRCGQCTMIHTIRQATSDSVFQCMQ